jgi:hypothetical protein
MPVRLMHKTCYSTGVSVAPATAACGKGFCVIINYPDGNRVVAEAHSRARANQIARAYGLAEHALLPM